MFQPVASASRRGVLCFLLLEVQVYSCERQERDDVIVIEQEQRDDYCVAVEVLLAWLTDALNEWDGSVIFLFE